MSDFTLADLTKLTSAKRRSVQIWAEAGVIQAIPETERAGTGTHRRFSRSEAIIACLINAWARRQQPVGVLQRIAALFREGLENPYIRKSIDKAINGNGEIYVILRGEGAGRAVLSLAGGAVDIDMSIAVIDGSQDDDIAEAVGRRAIEHLERFGSSATVILANPYLERLRK